MLSESKQLVMQNSQEAVFTKNLTKQNGKEKCFICLGDTNPPQEKFIEESDCLSLYYNKKNKYMLFNSNSKQGNGNKFLNNSNNNDSAPNQNLIIPVQLNSKNVQGMFLLSPCKCDKLAHMMCLTNYCIMNISFKCNKCNVNYAVEFSETKSRINIIIGILFLIMFVIFHLGIFLLIFLLFFGYFKFPISMDGLQIVIGCICFIVNLILIFFSHKFVRKIFKKKILKPSFSNNTEFKSSKLKIQRKLGSDFNKFMIASHKCSQLDLIEKKINNNIFLETIIKDSLKLSEFIRDNNNVHNIKNFGSSRNVNEEIMSLNKFNKPNVFSKLNSLKSQNSIIAEIQRQKSSQVKPNISDKNLQSNFESDKSSVIKSKTKSSIKVRDDSLIWQINKIEEVEEVKTKKRSKLVMISDEAKKFEYELEAEENKQSEDEKIAENLKSDNKLLKQDTATIINEEKNNLFQNVNTIKKRSHKRKLSINNHLRVMDSKTSSIENILKKKMNEKTDMVDVSIDQQINEEAVNSATFLNVDEII